MRKKRQAIKNLVATKLVPQRPIKVASIDIGSNAIRLMLAELKDSRVVPLRKYRVPIRLGGEVFKKGKISGKQLKTSARTFQKFKEILTKNKILFWRAVATSALREAKNRATFVALIRKKSGILVEVINGIEEAQLIHLALKKTVHLETQSVLLIDIGGGSVELSFSHHGQLVATHSFPFGTVRTLEKLSERQWPTHQLPLIIEEYVEPLNRFISSNKPGKKLDFVVGTGGNFEALGRMKLCLLNQISRASISAEELTKIINKLSQLSLKERIEKLGLRPDRADVILPAALIAQISLQLAGADRVLIPYVGLKDGVLWSMIETQPLLKHLSHHEEL